MPYLGLSQGPDLRKGVRTYPRDRIRFTEPAPDARSLELSGNNGATHPFPGPPSDQRSNHRAVQPHVRSCCLRPKSGAHHTSARGPQRLQIGISERLVPELCPSQLGVSERLLPQRCTSGRCPAEKRWRSVEARASELRRRRAHADPAPQAGPIVRIAGRPFALAAANAEPGVVRPSEAQAGLRSQALGSEPNAP